MTENLFRDDKLSVAVKADAEREIKKAYCALGWVLDGEYGDGKYGDIIQDAPPLPIRECSWPARCWRLRPSI